MTCAHCGMSTPRRVCRECERLERAEEAAARDDETYYECPSCGRDTTGEDVECYRCRSDGESGDDEAAASGVGTTMGLGARPRTRDVNSFPDNVSGSGGDGR